MKKTARVQKVPGTMQRTKWYVGALCLCFLFAQLYLYAACTHKTYSIQKMHQKIETLKQELQQRTAYFAQLQTPQAVAQYARKQLHMDYTALKNVRKLVIEER